jgi:hypothetical protein
LSLRSYHILPKNGRFPCHTWPNTA